MRELSDAASNVIRKVIAEALLQVEAHLTNTPEQQIIVKYATDPEFHRYIDLASNRIYEALNGTTTGREAERLSRILRGEFI